MFVVKRSQPLSGRTRVQWRTVSGTADAETDLAASASGSAEFADGQAQRAIYVALRNDAVAEGAETFTLNLVPSKGTRLGKTASATATIMDDD